MRLQEHDDAEPLPTDGMEVEEFRDADTVLLFMLEWRRRLYRELREPSVARGRPGRHGGMMGA